MQNWVAKETENMSLGDQRLTNRLSKILDRLSNVPAKSIPCANQTWAETYATYRFLDNEKVNFDSIMEGHQVATIDRIKQEKVVLIPQDTTFLNFATESEKKDMGTLRTKDSNQQLLHTSLAITPSRINMGVVQGSMWQRPEEKISHLRGQKKIEEKESIRWLNHYDSACQIQKQCPETTIVSIADREGDIHEWFQHAEKKPIDERASYIIRAKTNRRIDIDGEESVLLWDYLNQSKSIGKYSLNIPRRGNQKARTAQVKVYSKEVRLLGKGKSKRPLCLHVVYAKESRPPKGIKPIEWMLLTDLFIENYDQARTVIEWYRCRWEIEIYFRVLKGGCGVEGNRLRTETRMLNCIAVYMIIAWRLHSITMNSRANPDAPCSRVFSKKEWTAIWLMSKKEKPPVCEPTLREITRMLGGLGGFLARKGDGEPGVKNLWQGYEKLLHHIETIDLLAALD